jgi:hypothetical protein
MTTKWYDARNNMTVERDTPVSIGIGYDSTNENKVFYCKYCQRNLTNINNEEWICTNCNISHFPEFQDVRSKSKVIPHEGPNTEPIAAHPPDPNAPFYDKNKVQYKGGIAQLAKRSTLKILDYTETGGSGKILGRKRTWSKSGR